jgi:hypothetical protein
MARRKSYRRIKHKKLRSPRKHRSSRRHRSSRKSRLMRYRGGTDISGNELSWFRGGTEDISGNEY